VDWYSIGFVSVLECGCQSSCVRLSLASLPPFLKEMVCRDVFVWFYLALTIWSVTSVNACPVTFTNLKHCFIAFAIPSEKQWSCLRTYSVKVFPLHRPIFCICISKNPFRVRAHAPPMHKECVSICLIGIPQYNGYCKDVVACLSAVLMLSAVTLYASLSIQ
jgi:hypothetical protein